MLLQYSSFGHYIYYVRRMLNCSFCCRLHQPENMTEDEDILIGEGPTLDRQLSSQEKLHIIIGYALSRRDIR